MGLDQCVGQHVARLQAEALLTALARRVRGLALAVPTKRHRRTLRAWDSIPSAPSGTKDSATQRHHMEMGDAKTH
jgi:hypothetical protein